MVGVAAARAHLAVGAWILLSERKMRVALGALALFAGLSACSTRSEEAADETTRVATDTIVETRQVVDTMLVQTDTSVSADTAVSADTTIVADTTVNADTSIVADTTVESDTTRLEGDGGVISVDTTTTQ